LKAVSGLKYKITFKTIDTEYNKKCTKDYLTIAKIKKFKAGGKTKSNKFCGAKKNLKSLVWESGKNLDVTLKWKSNGSKKYAGFKIVVKAY